MLNRCADQLRHGDAALIGSLLGARHQLRAQRGRRCGQVRTLTPWSLWPDPLKSVRPV
jgi:hypothetical protein